MAKKFSSLTKREKRIVILKDALRWINTGVLDMTHGIVASIDIPDTAKPEDQLQPVLQEIFKKKGSCSVCQRGAILLSLVARDNDFRVCDLERSGIASEEGASNNRLEKLFSRKQLAMMETAFEKDHNREFLGEALFQKCLLFSSFKKFKYSETNRAKAILKNAIKNGGIFKP